MSRSWTESWQAADVAGLVIGSDYVACASARPDRGAWQVRSAQEADLPAPLFRGRPTPAARDALVQALRATAGGWARRYAAVHVSVPDAAIAAAVYPLDALPQSARTQSELAQFRLARDLGAEHALTVQCQALGVDGGKPLLLALGIDSEWLALITAALRAVDLVAWAVKPDSVWRFNRYHDLIARQGSGALVVLARGAWGMLLWDGAARPRLIRGRWRDTAHGAGTDTIAAEVERVCLAYVHGGAEHAGSPRTLDRVYVSGAGEGAAALVRALDARLREPCTLLPLSQGMNCERTAELGSSAELYAALSAARE